MASISHGTPGSAEHDGMYHILIIDDEPGISSMMREALMRFGYAVETAASGREALQRLKETVFDLVVTDMYLPDLEGACIVRQIRRSERPHTPVIGISGTPWMLDEADCDVVLPKPFPLNALVDAVRRLERQGSVVPPVPAADPLGTAPALHP